MNISFQGIGARIVTVKASGNLKKGDLCYFYVNKTVAPCASGAGFSGKVIEVYDDGSASVQIGGFIEVPYTDATPMSTLDLQSLVCTDAGSVHRDAGGRKYLVVSQDTKNKMLGIML